MTAHTHTVIVPGCYRCELSDDEMRDDHYAADVTTVGDIIGTVPVEDDDDNPYDHARRILRSDWLRTRDARVAAEALEAAAAAVAASQPILVASWLRARAAEYRTTDDDEERGEG